MTSRRVWSVLVGALLVLAVLSPPARAATTVTLSAHITNTDSLDQAGTVCLEPAGPPSSCGGSGIGPNGAWSRTWDVDANPGSYLIRVTSTTMDGHTRWYVAGDSAGTTDRSAATPVNLGPGAVDVHFDMAMPAIAKVTGTVQDNHGAPVAGATVFRSQSGYSRNVVTQADGSYSFGYVRAGVHSLSVNPVGDYAGTSGSMTVPAVGDYVAPDLIVQKAAAIHGTVLDSVTGDPIPMVNVEVYTAGPGTHTYQGSAYTDLAGNYRINQLGNQSLVARYTHEFGSYATELYGGGNPSDWSGEAPFVLNAEEDRTFLDMGLTAVDPGPPPAHNLSGTVTDSAGAPLAGILVDAPGLVGDETDGLGHWYIDAPAGTYRLRVADNGYWANRLFGSAPGWFPEYYPDAGREAAGTPVTVVPGQVIGNLDVSLERGALVKGSVRDATDGGTTNFGTHWLAYGPSGQVGLEQEYAGFFSGAAYSALVRPGTWRLLLRSQRFAVSSDVDYLPRWLGDADSFEAATPVTVAAGQTVTVGDTHVGTSLGASTPPVVSGTRAAGGVLTASTGTWTTMTLTHFGTTWWRGPVQVGSGPSYAVGPGDAGSTLQARVVATNGSHTATASSAPVAIDRLASAVAGRGASPKRGVVKLTITVTSTGLTPGGTLTVKRGAKVVKSGVALVGGRVVVKLTRQPSGTRRFTASYGGSTQVSGSAVGVKVRVR
jgi:protocatechuate 3,4-dioxygenase beta subunit